MLSFTKKKRGKFENKSQMEFFPNVNFPLIYPKILSFSIGLYRCNDKVGMEWHTHWISLTILLLKLPCLFVQCFVFIDFWIYTFLLISNHISGTKKATRIRWCQIDQFLEGFSDFQNNNQFVDFGISVFFWNSNFFNFSFSIRLLDMLNAFIDTEYNTYPVQWVYLSLRPSRLYSLSFGVDIFPTKCSRPIAGPNIGWPHLLGHSWK